MQPGIFASVAGHIAIVLMLLISWPASSVEIPRGGMVVPVEIVDIGQVSNVKALAPPPEPDQEVVPPAPAETPPAVEEPEPEPAPAPQPRQRRPRNELDLEALNRELLGNLRPKDRPQPRDPRAETSDRTREGAGAGTAETVAMEDRLRALMRAHIIRNQCWREPADARDPASLTVTVRIQLDRNGRLRGQPELVSPTSSGGNPEVRAAIDNALRAVRLCDPFPMADDPAAARRYDLWRETDYTFRPRS